MVVVNTVLSAAALARDGFVVNCNNTKVVRFGVSSSDIRIHIFQTLSKNRNFEKKFVDAEMGVKIGKLPRKSGELAALLYTRVF